MSVALIGTMLAGLLYPTAAACLATLLPGYRSVFGPPITVNAFWVLVGLLAVSMISFSASILGFILSTIVIWIGTAWYPRLIRNRMAVAVLGGLAGAIPLMVIYWSAGGRPVVIPFFLLAIAMGHFGVVATGYRSRQRLAFLQPVFPEKLSLRLADLFTLTVVVALALVFQRLSKLPLIFPVTIYLIWQFALLVVDEFIRNQLVHRMIDEADLDDD